MLKKAVSIFLMLIFVAGQFGATMQVMGMSLDNQLSESCSHCKCGGDACCVDTSKPNTPDTPATPPQTTTTLKLSLLARTAPTFQLSMVDSKTTEVTFPAQTLLETPGIPAYQLFCTYLI